MGNEVRIKVAVEIASENVDGVRKLGEIYGKTLAKATRKIIKDHIEFYNYTQGDAISIDRAKFQDNIEYDYDLTGISVPVKEFHHRLFKQECANQGIKLKHMVRGLFNFYADENITRRYNFEEQNILLEEWKKGNI